MIIVHWDMPIAVARNAKAAKKLFARFPHTAKAFGVTDVIVVALEEVPPYNDAEINLTVVESLDEALEFAKGTPVYVEVGGTPLAEYSFPDDPVFVFGSDFMTLPQADISIDADISLHAEVSLGIVLNQWRSR